MSAEELLKSNHEGRRRENRYERERNAAHTHGPQRIMIGVRAHVPVLLHGLFSCAHLIDVSSLLTGMFSYRPPLVQYPCAWSTWQRRTVDGIERAIGRDAITQRWWEIYLDALRYSSIRVGVVLSIEGSEVS
jgi:hypothetical protein